MAKGIKVISVEVAYALPNDQKIVQLAVHPETTVYEAIVQSGLYNYYPEINVESATVGIFGKVVRDPKLTFVREGERIEIYRPLLADPKEVRARKAAEKVVKEKTLKSS